MAFRGGALLVALAVSLGAPSITWSNAAEVVRSPADLKRQEVALHDLDIRDGRGTRLDLDHHPGKILIVNFWANWCAPCLQELPQMEQLKRNLGDKIDIVLVSSQNDWARDRLFAQQHHLSFPLYVYSRNEMQVDAAALLAKVRGPTTLEIPLPVTALFMPNGHLVDAFAGPKKWDSPTIEQDLRDLSQVR